MCYIHVENACVFYYYHFKHLKNYIKWYRKHWVRTIDNKVYLCFSLFHQLTYKSNSIHECIVLIRFLCFISVTKQWNPWCSLLMGYTQRVDTTPKAQVRSNNRVEDNTLHLIWYFWPVLTRSGGNYLFRLWPMSIPLLLLPSGRVEKEVKSTENVCF